MAAPRRRALAARTGRSADVARKTTETDIQLSLAIDGRGQYAVATGIPFLDHMLELFTKHGFLGPAESGLGPAPFSLSLKLFSTASPALSVIVSL